MMLAFVVGLLVIVCERRIWMFAEPETVAHQSRRASPGLLVGADHFGGAFEWLV
jgi:hypothetical protein